MLSDIPTCTDESGSTSAWIGRDFLNMHSPPKKSIYNTAIFHFCTTFDKEFLVKRRVKGIYTDLVSIALFSSIQMVMRLCLGELWGRIKMPASMSNCNLEMNDYNRRNRDTFHGRVRRQKLRLMWEM